MGPHIDPMTYKAYEHLLGTRQSLQFGRDIPPHVVIGQSTHWKFPLGQLADAAPADCHDVRGCANRTLRELRGLQSCTKEVRNVAKSVSVFFVHITIG
jgi:hypothetical protein